MDSQKTKLVIEFDNEEAALHFKHWLSGSGEQYYWIWMGYREEEEPEGDITALRFEWNDEDEFLIRAKCGRKDRK